jgi:hypothetical protein
MALLEAVKAGDAMRVADLLGATNRNGETIDINQKDEVSE